MKLAIIGHGFVGKATELLLTLNNNTDVMIHDPAQGYCIEDWTGVDYAFLCVPTPESEVSNQLDIELLYNVYVDMLDKNITPVIRSTIGPDQVAHFPKAIMMPEFLREANWEEDTHKINDVILGGEVIPPTLREVFPKRQVVMVSAKNAMMYKLTRNAVLATKVVIANQINEVCESLGADYNELVKLLNRNNTLGQTHWDVPGPDGEHGFGGKCFPKDIAHMSSLCNDKAHNIFKYSQKLNSKFRKEGK